MTERLPPSTHFDFDTLERLLSDPDSDVDVVIASRRSDADVPEAWKVVLPSADAERTANAARVFANRQRERNVVPHLPWAADEARSGSLGELDTGLLEAVMGAAWRLAGTPSMRYSRLYALVIRGKDAVDAGPADLADGPRLPDHTAVLARVGSPWRQVDQVEHQRAYRLTAENKLDPLDGVIVLDGVFDLLALGDRYLALDYAAFEATLSSPESRRLENERATAELKGLFKHDQAGVDRAMGDPRFAARVRRILQQGGFLRRDQMPGIEDAIRDYRLTVSVDPIDNALRLPGRQSARWDGLRVAEDAYVTGAVSGWHYEAPTKTRWRRLVVLDVIRGENGQIAGLVTEAGPVAVAEAIADINAGRVGYVVATDSEVVAVEVVRQDGNLVLWASTSDDDGANLLAELKPIPPGMAARLGLPAPPEAAGRGARAAASPRERARRPRADGAADRGLTPSG